MLLNFRVANYRSLKDEQELSLLIGPRRVQAEALETSDGAQSWDPTVGTVAGIYGANASGKSNVLNALIFMRRAVINSHQRWAADGGVPSEPFLLDPASQALPSLFEVNIRLGKVRYQYGFRLTQKEIVGEWLYAYPGPRRQIWFERDITADEEYYFGKSLTGRNRTIADLTRSNSLFLSSAAANNHRQLYRIYLWFLRGLRSASPDDREPRTQYTLEHLSDERRAREIAEMMQFADLGITDVRVRHEELPEELRERALNLFRAAVNLTRATDTEKDAVRMMKNLGLQVEFLHRVGDDSEPVDISLQMESLGTQVWFALVGVLLRTIAYGDTLLIDELDASLHPQLSAEILKMFRDPEKNPKQAQLIFTTHDTALLGTLLDERELHRDQIWFTEKRRDGSTVLYPLTDFSPRASENFERGYLQGRYGAVPVLDERILSRAVRSYTEVEEAVPEEDAE